MPHTFPSPFKPLDPPKGCRICGIGGLLGYYDGYWWCYDHFYHKDGPGARWPRRGSEHKVIFSDPQKKQAVERGTERREIHARKPGKKPGGFVKAKNKTLLQLDIEGAYGEVAGKIYFARQGFDVSMEKNNPDARGDKQDLTVEGKRIGLKTVNDGLNLLEPEEQRFDDDLVLVLAWSDFDKRITFKGWTTGKLFREFAKDALPTMDPGTKWMRYQDLRPMDELNERLRLKRDGRRRDEVPLVHERSGPEGDPDSSPEADGDGSS